MILNFLTEGRGLGLLKSWNKYFLWRSCWAKDNHVRKPSEAHTATEGKLVSWTQINFRSVSSQAFYPAVWLELDFHGLNGRGACRLEHSSDLRSTELWGCKDRNYILGDEEGARGDCSEASGQESTIWIYPKDKVAMLIGNDNNREEVEEPRQRRWLIGSTQRSAQEMTAGKMQGSMCAWPSSALAQCHGWEHLRLL